MNTTNVVLTNVFEIYIIEIEKYKERAEKEELDTWVKFLKNPEVITMNEKNKSVEKAKKILEEISSDERERYLAELRQKYIMDQKAVADAGYDKGVEQGIKQGIKQGREQGEKNKQLEIAKKLKEMNMSLSDIEKATGLTSKELKDL